MNGNPEKITIKQNSIDVLNTFWCLHFKEICHNINEQILRKIDGKDYPYMNIQFIYKTVY